MAFAISPAFSSTLLIYFSIESKKGMNFLVFSPKQVKCTSNSSASSFMIKW